MLRPEALEQLERLGAALGARHVAQPVGHVLRCGQVREERVVLEHEPAAAALGRKGRAVLAEPELSPALDAPAVGLRQSREQPQDRRLAGAARAGQREAVALGNLERDVELDRPDRRAELSAQHRRTPPSRPGT